MNWDGKRYYSFNSYLKQTFGEKVYKISLNGGFTGTAPLEPEAVFSAAKEAPEILHPTLFSPLVNRLKKASA